MQHTITLKRAHLVSLLTIAPKCDARNYLNTIRVEAVGESGVALVATDGRMLQAIEFDDGDAWASVCRHGDNDHGFMLKRSQVERFIKTTKGEDVELELEGVGDDFTAKLNDGEGLTVSALYSGGKYPDWHSVIPMTSKPDQQPVHVNAAYLATAQKAIGLAFGKSPQAAAQHCTRQHHIGDCVVVDSYEATRDWACLILVMGLKVNDAPRSRISGKPSSEALAERIRGRKSGGLQATGTG